MTKGNKKPPGERLDVALQITFTRADVDRLKAEAKARYVSVSQLVRVAVYRELESRSREA